MISNTDPASPEPETTQYLDQGTTPADGGVAPESPIWIAHRALSGRYRWAAILGLVLAGIGGYVGFTLAKPTWESRGVIHMDPVKSRLLNDLTGSDMLMPRYDAWLQSQAGIIKSQRIRNKAMDSDKWQSTGRGTSVTAQGEFVKNLTVECPLGEEIYVSYQDHDARVAMLGVQAIIEAYQQIFNDNQTRVDANKTQALENEKAKLTSEINGLKTRLNDGAGSTGFEAFERIYQAKIEAVGRLQDAYNELHGQLQMIEAALAKGAVMPSVTQPTVEQLAANDPRIRELSAQRTGLSSDLELLRDSLGSKHRTVVQMEAKLAQIDTQIETRRRELTDGNSNGAASDPNAPAPTPMSALKLYRERDQTLATRLATAKGELAELAKQYNQMAAIRNDLDSFEARLKQIKEQLYNSNVDSAWVGGRMDVRSSGDLPVLPVNESVRKKGAAAGILGGLMLGTGIVLVIGLRDQRVRNVQDVRAAVRGVPMLGVLPILPDDMSDSEQSAIAAHSVHHIRTLLQVSSNGSGRSAYVITSPGPGTGKTSLCLSLGLSYATSGCRTLLIDCDLVGGGLTHRVDAIVRRRIGQILRKGGLVSDNQLELALEAAKQTGRRLGEVLVEMGCLNGDDVTQAIVLQKESRVGLLDAAAGEPLEACVAGTAIPDLFILPLGSAEAGDAARLSPAAFRRVLSRARQQFDAVIIDTGPVPASIEASTVAAEADGVVLVVSRGEQRPMTDRAIERLVAVGARIAGLVYNRAATADIDPGSLSAGHASRGATKLAIARGVQDSDTRSTRFGPIARAVALYGSTTDSTGPAASLDAAAALAEATAVRQKKAATSANGES